VVLLGPQRIAVRRLRVRGAGSDAVAARLRTERALADLELRPRSLPPAAILLVRSLRTRLGDAPGAIEELFRTAPRPAHGAAPAGAAAVVFANQAELLACLAEDTCSGAAWGRWWWSVVVRDFAPGAVADAWIDAPEAVPAAFAILAARGIAVEFASRIDDARADALTDAIAQLHGVSVDRRPAAPQRRRSTGLAVPHPSVGAGRSAAPEPAPESLAGGLSPPQQRLLSVALTLTRAPAYLRMRALAEMPWQPPVERQPSLDASGARPGRAQAEAPHLRVLAAEARADPPPLAAASADNDSQAEPLPPPSRVEPPRVTRSRPRTAPSAVGGPPQPTPHEPNNASYASPSATGSTVGSLPAHDEASRADPLAREAETLSVRHDEAGDDSASVAAPDPAAESGVLAGRAPVETELGGLFFLLVVAQRLGLYADFTEPAAPGIALDPWRFVALVGARFVDPEPHADDALWPLLEVLARDEDTVTEQELDAHAIAVRVWLELNVDLPLRQVVERHALVHVDETRVDATFALARHPIEIRVSGLDVDPGWIPAAGRALYFHFE
jgi:hypothetical protein